jgi:signal peptidase II
VGDLERPAQILTAMRRLSRMVLVTFTLVFCVGCDQVSKSAARSLLADGDAHSYAADFLRLQLVENPGSFLSLGANLQPQARFLLFTGAVGALLLALIGAALFASKLGRQQAAALALVAGGGISNFIDRVFNDGRVTDFLNVGVGGLRTGIFNVADMLIMAGALFLILARNRGAAAAQS